MNYNLLIKGISAIIPGHISDLDFSVLSKLDMISSKELLDIFVHNGIGKLDNNSVNFHSSDKIRGAIFVLENGAPIEDVSELLNWKDFENLVSQILLEKEFDVERNLILTKPRMEIDVIGTKLNIVILIDCKHWKRMSNSALNEIVKKQVNRVKRYANEISDIMTVPVIVTLHQEQISFINKVPIVPIIHLSSFLDELYGNLDQIKTIEK